MHEFVILITFCSHSPSLTATMGCSVSKDAISDGAPQVDVPGLLRNVKNFLKTIKGTSLTKEQTKVLTVLQCALTKAKRVLLREINKAGRRLTIAQNKLNKKWDEFSTHPDPKNECVTYYEQAVAHWKDHLDNFVRFLYMVDELQFRLTKPFTSRVTKREVAREQKPEHKPEPDEFETSIMTRLDALYQPTGIA